MELVLASASPWRAELLKEVDFSFTIDPPDVREDIESYGCAPDICERLALLKARQVRSRHDEQAVVLGADTIVRIKNTILTKPEDSKGAAQMLRLLSGRTHIVETGIAMVGPRGEVCVREATGVQFRPISEAQILSYVASGECMDKAGAYAVQGGGTDFVTEIEGDYYNVVGMPITLVFELIRQTYPELLPSSPVLRSINSVTSLFTQD